MKLAVVLLSCFVAVVLSTPVGNQDQTRSLFCNICEDLVAIAKRYAAQDVTSLEDKLLVDCQRIASGIIRDSCGAIVKDVANAVLADINVDPVEACNVISGNSCSSFKFVAKQ